MNSSQVHSDQVGLELILPPKYIALETIVQVFLSSDSKRLIKLLLQIFSEKLRALLFKNLLFYFFKRYIFVCCIRLHKNFLVELFVNC